MALQSILIPPDAARDGRARALVGYVCTWPLWTLKQQWGSFEAGTVFRRAYGSRGARYLVNSVACQCPDYAEWKNVCKHIRAVVMWEAQQAPAANRDALAAWVDEQARSAGLAGQGETDLAFMEVATRLRGDGAGVALIRTYDELWPAEGD